MSIKKANVTRKAQGTIEDQLVKYSRAGDVFHYRWAARRCLRLVFPKSRVNHIIIEGSNEPELAGEYVIDVSEYHCSNEGDLEHIAYYQLKHTTVRKDEPFSLRDLQRTISGFAKRYSDYLTKRGDKKAVDITYAVVTNRPISESLKDGIVKIAGGDQVDGRFQKTIEKYTRLGGSDLVEFCSLLRFEDGEGDYDIQRNELHAEMAQILAGTVDDPRINSIIDLVQEKVLPNSDGRIDREAVLQRLGVSSPGDLFPAPPDFENLDDVIVRKQHEELRKFIVDSSVPVIIHAAGGVGKSVFARQISASLPNGSMGIVYDCFGGGRYRNRSEPRHRHRDALVQISNELALQELCAPFVVGSTDLDDQIMKGFLKRLDKAAGLLRSANKNAILVVLIDAADNAEMAAQEFGETCFAHQLLRESMPAGCRLVMLCRTERIDLLHPPSKVLQLELQTFSEEETLYHLRKKFPDATTAEGTEFHRLTNDGNPRVQANALSLGLQTVTETLTTLGPVGTTLERQIEAQLDSAVSLVKERFPIGYQDHVDAICLGLASLPPFVPLEVLAKAASVDEATVKSFISDIGRPLWLSDTSVQFRDEPTETWFRQRFIATPEQIATYITRLEPLAAEYPYVAQALPSLFLNAGKYHELIELALSDKLLPTENPIDERNVRVYRLKFAFKAALKLKKYADATRLALRAGEEVAGDKRQLQLLTKNVDLIAPLQDIQKVQELAFRRMLRSGWEGSENVYSASLLSSVESFKGEARSYLRAAANWLHLYFEERKKKKEDEDHFQELLKDQDIVELASTIFNLEGTDKLVEDVFRWSPPELIYRIMQKLFRRFVDANNMNPIQRVSQLSFPDEPQRYLYLAMALAYELLDIGKLPDGKVTRKSLDLLVSRKNRIPKPTYAYRDTTQSALVALLESCAANRHSRAKILRALNYYLPQVGAPYIGSDYQKEERDPYLRALALRRVLEDKSTFEISDLFPKEFKKKKKKNPNYEDQEVRNFKESIGGLLPWYTIRARLLVNGIDDFFEALKEADRDSKNALSQRHRDRDPLHFEITHVLVEILSLARNLNTAEVEKFVNEYLKENKQVWIDDWFKVARCAFRSEHMLPIRRQLEVAAREVIETAKDQDPETKADWFIELARAVFPASQDDAAAYFNFGIEAVSKFGDELVQRWEAITALGRRSADGGQSTPEMAYRFARCAELIGENVDREKHWSRSSAIRVCTRLSPVSAFAVLSRWRDRDIGAFEQQLPALADEIVRSNYVVPSVAWSLSTFLDDYWLDDFSILCIERSLSTADRQQILDIAVRDLRLIEAEEKRWHKLREVAREYALSCDELNEVYDHYAKKDKSEKKLDVSSSRVSAYRDNSESFDWEDIFGGLELINNGEISRALHKFNSAPLRIHNRQSFWQEAIIRVNDRDALRFLETVIEEEGADWYDIKTVFSVMPSAWRQKASVKKNWSKLFRLIGKRFAVDFTNGWSLEYLLQDISGGEEVKPQVQEGIMDGLSSNVDLVDANSFFGFAEIASPYITPKEATDLMDFGLSRFERHIEENFADGRWNSWLEPPKDIDVTFTGLIWSALASPRAEIRWRAAHSVRRLAQLNCAKHIDLLLEWMNRDKVEAFGSKEFPFYNLHARLYLLIALARIAIDNQQILRGHYKTFSRLALGDLPHILIQKFAADIALRIEKAYPKTYKPSVVDKLRKIGVSQLPIRNIENYGEVLESYWHQRGEVDTTRKFYHGYDFSRYWFDPLGDVFGIPGKQVEELATEIIIKELRADKDGSYYSDPRSGLWQSNRNERETWHDHGSYPRTDNYSFYFSYHSMLILAARLIEKIPVVKKRGWFEDEDQWREWLHRHSLTRSDGKWLADRRDPAPLIRPQWIKQTQTDDWFSQVSSEDFLNAILIKRDGKTWLHVDGYWTETHSGREEEVHVSMAVVSKAGSQSLLNALTTCSDPHDFKLPEYNEERMEFDQDPFILKGWLWRGYNDRRLDEYDPYSGRIAFPPYQVGESFVEKLELLVDTDQREWFLPDAESPSLFCELWSTKKPDWNEDPLRQGERFSASLEFLQYLCRNFDCNIIFDVQIGRRYSSRSYARNEKDYGYKPPRFRIFLLTEEGQLRDAEADYKIG